MQLVGGDHNGAAAGEVLGQFPSKSHPYQLRWESTATCSTNRFLVVDMCIHISWTCVYCTACLKVAVAEYCCPSLCSKSEMVRVRLCGPSRIGGLVAAAERSWENYFFSCALLYAPEREEKATAKMSGSCLISEDKLVRKGCLLSPLSFRALKYYFFLLLRKFCWRSHTHACVHLPWVYHAQRIVVKITSRFLLCWQLQTAPFFCGSQENRMKCCPALWWWNAHEECRSFLSSTRRCYSAGTQLSVSCWPCKIEQLFFLSISETELCWDAVTTSFQKKKSWVVFLLSLSLQQENAAR